MDHKINPVDVPKRKLYTGEEIPVVGLGTFGSDKYTPEQVSNAVFGAILSGYRLIDCASVYQNEDRIGEVLQRIFKESEIKREELFITSKVWNDMHREVLRSCEKSLKDLQLIISICILCIGLSRTIMRPAAAAIPGIPIPGLFPSTSLWIRGNSAKNWWTKGWCVI